MRDAGNGRPNPQPDRCPTHHDNVNHDDVNHDGDPTPTASPVRPRHQRMREPVDETGVADEER